MNLEVLETCENVVKNLVESAIWGVSCPYSLCMDLIPH